MTSKTQSQTCLCHLFSDQLSSKSFFRLIKFENICQNIKLIFEAAVEDW